MARPRRAPEQKNKDVLRREITKQLAFLDLEQKDLAGMLDVCPSTVCGMLKDVDTIKPPRMRQLVQTLDLDPEALLRFFGYSDKQIRSIGRRYG